MQYFNSKLLYPLAGMATLASCQTEQKSQPIEPLNIVYIMTDDHTRQMMSSYDNKKPHSIKTAGISNPFII